METNYARAIRITWIITGLCLIVFLTMWLMSNFGIDWRKDWFFLVFSIPMFLLCIITLPVLYQYRGKQISGMKDIAAGKELARWTYDEQAWSNHFAAEWKRVRTKAITVPVGFVALFVAVGLFAKGLTMEEIGKFFPWVVALAALISLAAMGYGYSVFRKSSRMPREMIATLHGVSIGGKFTSWETVGTRLADVRRSKSDAMILEFDIATWSRYGSRSTVLRVPIPVGKESEADELIARLNKQPSVQSQL